MFGTICPLSSFNEDGSSDRYNLIETPKNPKNGQKWPKKAKKGLFWGTPHTQHTHPPQKHPHTQPPTAHTRTPPHTPCITSTPKTKRKCILPRNFPQFHA